MKQVKVAKYRQLIDAAFRSANCHYHSCVGASELRTWKMAASSWLKELEETTCQRAKKEDHESKEYSIRCIREKLEKADARIQEYEDEMKALECKKEPSLQQLIDACPNIEIIHVH